VQKSFKQDNSNSRDNIHQADRMWSKEELELKSKDELIDIILKLQFFKSSNKEKTKQKRGANYGLVFHDYDN